MSAIILGFRSNFYLRQRGRSISLKNHASKLYICFIIGTLHLHLQDSLFVFSFFSLMFSFVL
jgi:hypothetical protein